MKRLVPGFVALLCVSLAWSQMSAADELKVGDMAPDFELPGTDGKTYRLSDLTAKQAVVIAWFPKAKTGGCTAECKSMKEYGEALREFDVAYFTASCDMPDFNKEFATELELDYPILSDPEHQTSDAYGVTNDERKFPQRWTFYIGQGGKILHIDKDVKTKNHGTDIAAKLAELGVSKKK
ncbi:MAG: peroxiredoxin [Pirellulales bacterium]